MGERILQLVPLAVAVVATLPIAIPVALVLVGGPKPSRRPTPSGTGSPTHTSVLNAALMPVICVRQLQKAISALL